MPATSKRVLANPQEEYPYRDEVLALTKGWYEHPIEVLDRNSSPLHVILNFEDLIRCPDVITRDLYARFGYARSRDLE